MKDEELQKFQRIHPISEALSRAEAILLGSEALANVSYSELPVKKHLGGRSIEFLFSY